jgi:hypothetical protein
VKTLFVIVCFFILPLAAYLKTCNLKTRPIKRLLSLLFFVPGADPALWAVPAKG